MKLDVVKRAASYLERLSEDYYEPKGLRIMLI